MDNIFNDVKYTKWYFNIIESAKHKTYNNIICEYHHIIPKCMGGDDHKDNLIKLSVREHLICHKLLYKMVNKSVIKARLVCAYFRMARGRQGLMVKLSEREKHVFMQEYKEARKILATGRKHSQETKNKISKASSGRKCKESSKELIGLKNKGRLLGIKISAEHKYKISRSLIGKTKTVEHVKKINNNPEKIKKTAEKHRGSKRPGCGGRPKGSRATTKNMVWINNPKTLEKKFIHKNTQLPKDFSYGQGKRNQTYITNTTYEILTPNGFKDFDGLSISSTNNLVELELYSGKQITSTPDHAISTGETWRLSKDFVVNDYVKTSDGIEGVKNIIHYNKFEYVYDLVNVQDTHSFYANNILVHNCIYLDEYAFVAPNIADEFYTSVFPTISSGSQTKVIITSTPNGMNHFYEMWMNAKEGRSDYVAKEIQWSDVPGRDDAWKQTQIRQLGSLEKFEQEHGGHFLGGSTSLIEVNILESLIKGYKEPITTRNDLKIYEEPVKGNNYVLVADVSRGQDLDYSAFSVFDITTTPYKQVAVYRSNLVSTMFYPNVIHHAARLYNEAFVLIELNDLGAQVADILYTDLEYENLLYTTSGKGGQKLTWSRGKSAQPGVKTSKSTKSIGCVTLKELISHHQLIINDFDTMKELTTFNIAAGSYAADPGSNDDLVMGLVLFSWLTTQTSFSDLTNINIREKLASMQNLYSEDPIDIIIDDGVNDPEQEIMRTRRYLWQIPD